MMSLYCSYLFFSVMLLTCFFILTVFNLQTQNRMKLMADNYEDDHLKTAPDQTNHKPSPDQVASPHHQFCHVSTSLNSFSNISAIDLFTR